ncbi:MAG TPA: hypothetical protein VM581_00585 [Magnetospirillaceae bacterium]|nr:hypothetical protein [Magnetospirillaceae bacterium]
MLEKNLSQSTRRGWRRIGIVAASVVAALGLGATAAIALTTSHSATRFTQIQVRTGDTAWTGATTAWTDVPGAATTFSVPTGQSRMFDATFSAESHCASSGWCSARVVIVTPSGSVVELRPTVGTDFAFDSPSDLWEGHSMNRTSYYWGAGTYTVKVQAALVAGATSFRLDDWNFGVRAYAS